MSYWDIYFAHLGSKLLFCFLYVPDTEGSFAFELREAHRVCTPLTWPLLFARHHRQLSSAEQIIINQNIGLGSPTNIIIYLFHLFSVF